jgi:hypothetical protein
MKITSTFHVVVSLVVLLTVSTPLIAFRGPDPTQPAKPHKQAKPAKQVDTTAEQNPESTQPLDPAEALKMQAIADAQKDVEAYINKPMWFMIGCMLPVFGLITPYLYKPPIPAGELIGKSPEYVAYYTDAYQVGMEKMQFRYALNGFITAGAVNCIGLGCLTITGAFAGL